MGVSIAFNFGWYSGKCPWDYVVNCHGGSRVT